MRSKNVGSIALGLIVTLLNKVILKRRRVMTTGN